MDDDPLADQIAMQVSTSGGSFNPTPQGAQAIVTALGTLNDPAAPGLAEYITKRG